MGNCSQPNNTKIETSAVSYDGTQIPCTNIKTCDDLNTILTKFDNVICSATASVNTLVEEVMDITETLMLITEEIENINNQIFICCPICDFTVTATELPVCGFGATAQQLPVCDFTGETHQVPDPTTTTTSSSTSTSTTSTSTSTSTSTTTIPPTTTSTTTFNNYQIEDCITSNVYTLAKTYVMSLGDVVQYKVGVPGVGLQRCGTIISTTTNLPPTASFFSPINYTCDDTLHCPSA